MIEGGLALEIPDGDPDREQLDAAAGALRGLLGVDVFVRTAGAPSDGDWTGTTLRLPAGPERIDRLRYLASTVEAL